MTFTTGTDFTGFTPFTPGTDFSFSDTSTNNYSQLTIGQLILTGETFGVDTSGPVTNAKVTKQFLESLSLSDAVPNAKVTKQFVESLSLSDAVPNAKVTKQFVEILYTRNLAYSPPIDQRSRLFVHVQ